MLIALLITCLLQSNEGPPSDCLIPLNLDYQKPGVVDRQMPWGWSMRGMTMAGVSVTVESEPDGLAMSRLDDGIDARVVYDLNHPFAGRRLTIEATATRPESSNASIRLGLVELDVDWNVIESWSKPIGTGVISTSLDVSADSSNAQLMVEYVGRGEVRLTPLRLRLDGVPVDEPFLPMQVPPTDADVTYVRDHAVPLATTDPTEPLDDLNALERLIGDRSIIMLGESTHGTREFFQLRDRIIRWLGEREDDVVLVFEDHPVAVSVVDQYVQTGEGDPAAAVSGLFGVWARQETLDFVKALRAATESGDIHVKLVGVDLQVPIGSFQALESFASAHDPALAVILEDRLGMMRQAWNAGWYPQRSAEELVKWIGGAAEVIAYVDNQAASYAKVMDQPEVDQIRYHARILWQSARNSAATSMRLRDRFMAENLAWIRQREPAHARFVVWAHNTHIRLDEDAMGQHVEALFPGDTYSIGLFTHRGDYTAYSGRAFEVYPLFPGPPESVEFLLNETGHDALVLDMSRGDDAALPSFLKDMPHHRNIGLWSADLGFYRAPVTQGFHALAFIAETSATTPIAPN